LNALVASLVRKKNNALKSIAALRVPFEDLTSTLQPTQIAEWTEMEKKAMEKRGSCLKIYSVKKDKGRSLILVL
jgi:hypothetical protein